MFMNLAKLRSWINLGLSFVYPEVCQYCKKERAGPEQGYVGQECQKQIVWIERPFCERCGLPFPGEITTQFVCQYCQETECFFSTARSAVGAKGMVLDIIHRYKYSKEMWFEPFLTGMLVRQALPVLRMEHWDLVIPVPLHRLRKSERGFNQAERLARALSKATEIPLDTRYLRRVQETRTQTRLSRKERAENVRHAFAVRKGHDLKGRRVVLVDDVRTTGATTNECARVLQEAGTDEVCIWTLSRGLLN